MDYKLIIKAIAAVFPVVGDTIKWIQRNVKKYDFEEVENTLVITIEFKDKQSMKQALKTLKPIIEGLLG